MCQSKISLFHWFLKDRHGRNRLRSVIGRENPHLCLLNYNAVLNSICQLSKNLSHNFSSFIMSINCSPNWKVLIFFNIINRWVIIPLKLFIWIFIKNEKLCFQDFLEIHGWCFFFHIKTGELHYFWQWNHIMMEIFLNVFI